MSKDNHDLNNLLNCFTLYLPQSLLESKLGTALRPTLIWSMMAKKFGNNLGFVQKNYGHIFGMFIFSSMNSSLTLIQHKKFSYNRLKYPWIY